MQAAVPPTAEATPPVASTDEAVEWKNLVAKFNGDQNAAAKAYWETNNRASQLSREKEELAAKLAAYEKAASPAAPEAPKPAPQDLPIELKRYDEKIRSVETNFAVTQKEKATYVQEGNRLDGVIRTLTRQLGSNKLDLDREDLTLKLTEAISERDAVSNYVAELDRRLYSFDEKWQELKENREIRAAILEQKKELEAAREAKARSDEEAQSSQYIAKFQTDWNSTIDKVSKDTSVIPAVLSQRFEKFVRMLGKAFVADGQPIEDVNAFVLDAAKDFVAGAKDFHSAQSAQYAKEKINDAKTDSPKDAMATETKRGRSDWTPQQWRDFEPNIEL